MTSTNNTPWFEKYRPKTLNEILHHDVFVKMLKTAVKTNIMPHLLLYGPPGTGKTSLINSCAWELYGAKKEMLTLTINASEERGIDTVRNLQKFLLADNIFVGGDQFKLIILDEADAMTFDAQAMLRKVIEKYSYCARFCLICNYIKKIMPALQSRCTCYHFTPLPLKCIQNKLIQISENEDINITQYALTIIVNKSKGDLRK